MKNPLRKTRNLVAAGALLALVATASARADYQSTVLSQGPVGYWRLNETIQPSSGTTAANLGSLGANGTGTYMNYASGGFPGPFEGSTAVRLDGASQYVSTPWAEGLNGNPWSVELWVCPDTVPYFGYIASSGDMSSPRAGWYLAQDDGTTFNAGSAFVVRFFNQNGTTQTIQYAAPAPATPGTWVHLVITYDGSVGSFYKDGALVTSAPAAYVPAVSAPFTIGCRSSLNFFWPGKAAEVAMYNSALSAARVAAHYNTGMTSPLNYQATVSADAPVLYHRYTESGAPPADNLGTLGNAADGAYIYDTTAGVAGPASPTYPGFEAANKAANFSGGGGVVLVPALNLKTNTVTISGWFKAQGSQATGAGLVVCGSGTSACGLTMDRVYNGLGLGYVWAGNDYGVSFSSDLYLPPLPDGQWAYAALVIEPEKATIYVCDRNNYANFFSVENSLDVNHTVQPFSANTLFGAESGFDTRRFKGAADEVAIFNRALSAGELYTQYATAVGGVPPRLFAELTGPTEEIPVGDAIVLTVDAGGTPPLTYTWRKDGSEIATTSSGTLTVANATLAEAGSYDVTISSASGSVSSGPVYVAVVNPSKPEITATEGFVNRTLYPGATLRLGVTATGGGLKYQWYNNGTAIPDATAMVYTVRPVTNTHAGSYSVVVTNTMGSASHGPVAIAIATYEPGSYEAAVLASAPESWWRLDETAGSTTLLDAMGRHDGYYTNLNGTTPPVTLGVDGALLGNPNTAASFAGAGGVGVIPNSPLLSPTKVTYEVWVRAKVADNADLVPFSNSTSSGGHWWQTAPVGFWTPRGNSGQAPIYDNGITEAVVIPNVWTHLVMCYDASRTINGTLYPWSYFVNGLTDGSVWTGDEVNAIGPVIIGGRGRTGDPMADLFFNGQVDEVAVYPRILPESEIDAHLAARGVEIIAPTFTSPLLSQTVTAGKAVTFTTSVLGTSPTLEWSKDGTVIPEITDATLNLGSVSAANQGTYTLRASNAAGTNSVSATLVVISPVGYANVTNDSVLHLRFDGDAMDSSGRGNHGTAVGAVAYPAGLIGAQALQYTTTTVTNNGTDIVADTTSYVNLNTLADLAFDAASSFTVGMWVKLPVGFNGGDLPFIGNATNSMNNPGWVLGPTYGGGGWQWCLNDGSNNLDVNGPDGSINDGNWHHYALVVDRTAKRASSYLDGVLMAQRDITQMGTLDTGAPIVIGQDPTGQYPPIPGASTTDFEVWGNPSTATLDDLGVWRRALSALDVAQIESAGRTAGRSFDTVAPQSVVITIAKSGSNFILSWPEGILLETASISGPTPSWTPVAGASAPSHTVTPGTGNRFYRVELP